MSFHPDDTRHPLDQLRDYDRGAWDEVDSQLNPGGVRLLPAEAGPSLSDVMAANLLVKALGRLFDFPADFTMGEKIALLRGVQGFWKASKADSPFLPCPCCGRTNTPATTSSEDKATTGESDA